MENAVPQTELVVSPMLIHEWFFLIMWYHFCGWIAFGSITPLPMQCWYSKTLCKRHKMREFQDFDCRDDCLFVEHLSTMDCRNLFCAPFKSILLLVWTIFLDYKRTLSLLSLKCYNMEVIPRQLSGDTMIATKKGTIVLLNVRRNIIDYLVVKSSRNAACTPCYYRFAHGHTHPITAHVPSMPMRRVPCWAAYLLPRVG